MPLRIQLQLGIDRGYPGTSCDSAGMVGQLTLDQHIGVRIPGGQPNDNKAVVHPLAIWSPQW